eukprot:GILI01007737.1.p1 GENE.GILI01007737.1~~GILI01007737.1.p1  ORF type:complete len:385 (-),score=103.46 GILI01007737.1:110-1264(-)
MASRQDPRLEFLQTLQTSHVDLAAPLSTIADLYQRKLWHQLTDKLLELVKAPSLTGQSMINLYTLFIKDFEAKINQLKLVQLVAVISAHFPNVDESFKFLEEIGAKVSTDREASLFCQSYQAMTQLKLGNLDKCLELVEKMKADLEGLAGLDPIVHSHVYKIAADYYKVKSNASGFYKNSLLFLSYTPVSTMPSEQKVSLAFDLGIAALVADDIYGFGELLEIGILNSLEGSSQEWLLRLVEAVNGGKISEFNRILSSCASQMNTLDALRSASQLLRQKVIILALVELVFNRPKGDRTLSFQVIAEATELPLDQVELLVMKAMSLGIIRGVIDEVEGVVRVSWVQPRVLDLPRIAIMRDRLEEWTHNVHNVLVTLEQQTPELFV